MVFAILGGVLANQAITAPVCGGVLLIALLIIAKGVTGLVTTIKRIDRGDRW